MGKVDENNKYIKKENITERTIIYSPDSDMIILLMMLNNNNILLRHDQQNTKLDDDFNGNIYNILEVNKFKYTLIDYINKRKNPYITFEDNRFINDVILIFVIFGDDFLPKLENFRVSNDIFTILDYYMINYQENGYLLNKDKSIKKIALNTFFILLSHNEYLFLERNRKQTIFTNYHRVEKEYFGYNMFIFREMVFELIWKFIYKNKDKFDNQTVNPQNINYYLDHNMFLKYIENEDNFNIDELGQYTKRFLKYSKNKIYDDIKKIFTDNYLNIIKYLNIDSFYNNTKKYKNKNILNKYNKLYYLADSKYNFLNDILTFMYYNSLQLPFNLTFYKDEPKLLKINYESTLHPHKNNLLKLKQKENLIIC